MRDGWELGGDALAVAVRGRNLRIFALGACGGAVLIEIAIAVAAVTLRHKLTLPERLVGGLLSAYVVAFLTNLAAVGLAGLADRALDDEEPPPVDGWRLMWVRMPQVAGWALIVVLVGIPARVLTGWGADQLAAVLLGFGWAVVSFFAIPAIALAGDGPVAAGIRSLRLVGRQWGSQVVGMVYVWLRPIAFIGVPGALAVVLGVVLILNDRNLLGWSVAAGGVVAIAIAYLLVVTANSVLSVALYRFAQGEPLPAEFDVARLERVLRAPAPRTVRLVGRLEGERVRRLRWRLQQLVSSRDSRPD